MTRPGRSMLYAFWMLLAVDPGCKQDDPFPQKPRPSLETARSVATSSAPTGFVSSARRQESKRPENPAEQLVMAWNAALDARDINQLVPLYGPRILFYGVKKNPEQVLATKRRQLARIPDYRQRIDNVRIMRSAKGYVVEFDKWSGPTASAGVRARLVLETIAGRLFIAEESDAVSDERLREPARNVCVDAALGAAAAQAAILSEQERVAAQVHGVGPGVIVYQSDSGNVQASSGFFHPERFEARWWIDVVAGEITILDAYTSAIVPVSEEERERVRQACSGPKDTDAGGG